MIHFLKTLWDYYRGKTKLLNEYFIELRYDICKDCEHWRKGWFRTYCNECKCTISNKQTPFNKCAYSEEECPLEKWGKMWVASEVKNVKEI